MNKEFLTQVYLGNTVGDYIRFLLITVSGTLLLLIIGIILKRRIKKLDDSKEAAASAAVETAAAGVENSETGKPHKRDLSGTLLRFFHKIVLPLLFLGVLAVGLSQLSFQNSVMTIVNGVFTAIITVVIIRTINKSIEISFTKYFSRESLSSHERNLKPLLVLVKFIMWIVGLIFLLANLGFDVSAAVAGLGVSGIAVAIAAQGILGDLFNYFVILFDKPFELGDFIIFDDKLGVVEKIGIKTTHIRTLQGEVLVVANSDLANARLHNFKKMQRRRVVLQIGTTYQTSLEHVRAVPGIIREIIETVASFPGVICDRSHFKGFGAYSLDFETVYYIPSPDYTVYMNVQQEINQRIYAAFADRGIEFAYPTQTLFVEKNPDELVTQ